MCQEVQGCVIPYGPRFQHKSGDVKPGRSLLQHHHKQHREEHRGESWRGGEGGGGEGGGVSG